MEPVFGATVAPEQPAHWQLLLGLLRAIGFAEFHQTV